MKNKLACEGVRELSHIAIPIQEDLLGWGIVHIQSREIERWASNQEELYKQLDFLNDPEEEYEIIPLLLTPVENTAAGILQMHCDAKQLPYYALMLSAMSRESEKSEGVAVSMHREPANEPSHSLEEPDFTESDNMQ